MSLRIHLPGKAWLVGAERSIRLKSTSLGREQFTGESTRLTDQKLIALCLIYCCAFADENAIL